MVELHDTQVHSVRLKFCSGGQTGDPRASSYLLLNVHPRSVLPEEVRQALRLERVTLEQEGFALLAQVCFMIFHSFVLCEIEILLESVVLVFEILIESYRAPMPFDFDVVDGPHTLTSPY